VLIVDDQSLWEKIRRGDAVAFEMFYRSTAQPLQNFLFSYVGERQSAEDISHETFIQLWQHPNGFDPGKSKLRTYLFAMARHRAADWWRRERSHGKVPEILDHVDPRGEARVMLDDALRQLDPDGRSLLWLREVEGHSYYELASILGIPVGTVRSRLFTAREELRRIWKSKSQSV
jgi:RNA polymerase sigma-70 factor, ECF subfamily